VYSNEFILENNSAVGLNIGHMHSCYVPCERCAVCSKLKGACVLTNPRAVTKHAHLFPCIRVGKGTGLFTLLCWLSVHIYCYIYCTIKTIIVLNLITLSLWRTFFSFSLDNLQVNTFSQTQRISCRQMQNAETFEPHALVEQTPPVHSSQ